MVDLRAIAKMPDNQIVYVLATMALADPESYDNAQNKWEEYQSAIRSEGNQGILRNDPSGNEKGMDRKGRELDRNGPKENANRKG